MLTPDPRPLTPAGFLLAALFAAAVVSPAAAQPTYDHLRIMAPAAPGGGWDQTARAMQQVLQRTAIARTVSVENIPGAAGLIGLARFIGAEQGNGDALMASGLIMLGAIVTQRSPVTLRDVTPIARLTGEYEVIAVPAASPFQSLDGFIQAFKTRPEAISWGGGSAGGSDQILAGLIADAVGVAPRRVNYIAFSGGGESLSAILGGQVSVGVNGLAEFAAQIEARTLRALAISSGERLPGLDIPTLREQGVDIEFENWRSVVAPPGITTADRRRLEAAVDSMARSAAWRETLERYRWLDRYLAADAFARFVEQEEARVQEILAKLGTTESGTRTLLSAGPYPLIVLSGLALLALAAIWGRHAGRVLPPQREGVRVGGPGHSDPPTSRIHPASANASAVRRAGPRKRTGQPALASRVAQRPDVGEGGKDPAYDATERVDRPGWAPIALIAAGLIVDLVLAEWAGFIIASAVLFWFVARAFDPRHPFRDAVFGTAVSIGAYLLFGRVLDLPLPAGVLGTWM